jgi:transcriptional regulator with XRE-family HTH domain
MVIADRLKALREKKNMSQGEIERRSGLLRCYISRVENGHTVRAIEMPTLLARDPAPDSLLVPLRSPPKILSKILGDIR